MWPFGESKQAGLDRREAQLAAHRKAVIEKNEHNFYKGAAGVAIAGTATVLAALMCKRSVVARRYKPGLFQANILPPPFNPMKDAARAVADATVLAGSLFALGMASGFWIYGVGTLRELGQVLSTRYKQRQSTDPEVINDPESTKVTEYLTGLLRGNK